MTYSIILVCSIILVWTGYLISVHFKSKSDMWLVSKFKIISASSPEELTKQVNDLMEKGWKPVGNHLVVETHRQNRYRGQQHIDTLIKSEYSQTLIKYESDSN